MLHCRTLPLATPHNAAARTATNCRSHCRTLPHYGALPHTALRTVTLWCTVCRTLPRTLPHTAACTAAHCLTTAYTLPHCYALSDTALRTVTHCRSLRTAAHCRLQCQTLPLALPHTMPLCCILPCALLQTATSRHTAVHYCTVAHCRTL
jgi:hypothetical protein